MKQNKLHVLTIYGTEIMSKYFQLYRQLGNSTTGNLPYGNYMLRYKTNLMTSLQDRYLPGGHYTFRYKIYLMTSLKERYLSDGDYTVTNKLT